MWGTVLIMAVVAGVDPARIGAVAFILSRPKPMGLLGAYLFGGFGVSLIAGGLIVFVLGESGIGKSSSVPPEIEIAVGGLALVVSVLVATGIAARIRDRVQARRPRPDGASQQGSGDEHTGIEKVPGFEKLPDHVQDVLRSESPWVAWIAGVAVGMPSAYYLAAIAAILKAGTSTGAEIAALLVFSHQIHMTNLLTRAGWEARAVDPELHGSAAPDREQTARIAAMMGGIANEVVDYLLFIDEAPLPDAIRGSSGFAERFSADGRSDGRGRSLHQLDLRRRLMKYPCSYLIYSPAFDALPPAIKNPIYRRMWQILSGQEHDPRYRAALSRADRQAIVEILRATKVDLPPFFLGKT